MVKKKRRLSRSDERTSKKLKLGEEKELHTPISVFQRLGLSGSKERGSGSKSLGDKNHYALVAASVPSHSVHQIVLTSGKIVEEGLMVNFNPSSPI